MKTQLNARKIFTVCLVLIMIFQTIYGIELIKDTSNPNIYRMVGLGYYDCWKTSGNIWQGGIAPNSTHTLPFTFTLGPDKIPRNIKKVTVRKVNMSSGSDQEIWNASRIPNDSFEDRNQQSVTSYNVINYSPTGAVDSRNVTITVNATVTLTAPVPYKLPTDGMAAGVEGVRYYVPIMIEIELYPDVKTVTVQHFNANTGQRLAENDIKQVAPNTSYTASAKDFSPDQFLNVKISYDNGVSWAETLTTTSVTKTITKDTIIRFYYGKPPDTNINAALKLSANPPNIEKGKTANVTLTLDGSQSTSKATITKYEFWVSQEEGVFKTTPDFTGTKPIQTSAKAGVASGTTYYVKLKVTDSNSKSSEVVEAITIGEYVPVQKATADADIQLVSISNPNLKVLSIREVSSSTTSRDYEVDIWVPEWYRKSEEFNEVAILNYVFTAANSKSTNGIGEYLSYSFLTDTDIKEPYSRGSSDLITFSKRVPITIDDMVPGGMYENDNTYWANDEWVAFKVIDSIDTTATALYNIDIGIKYLFEGIDVIPGATPSVKLTTDKPEYLRQQTAQFTTTYTNTDKIINKDWSIVGVKSTYEETGTGNIPSTYYLDIPTGDYKATQTIYYEDEEGETASASSEVIFTVAPLHKPQVSLKIAKDKYVMPATVDFTPSYVQNSETYPITSKYWFIEQYIDGGYEGITDGTGDIPDTLIDFNWEAGQYQAIQMIYWKEYGKTFSAQATVTFKITDPRPVADFKVEMKTSTTPTWSRIDGTSNTGKQYRQVRIDLSPSSLVQDPDNPYPIQFANANTQIQIVPLTSSSSTDLARNNTVKFVNNGDYTLLSNTITISAKQSIDVRFDGYGKYRIRVRVSNGVYTSGWIARDITITEDKPPQVAMTLEDSSSNKVSTIYRDSNDLHARYNIKLNITAGDDDLPDIANLKLKFMYDYNANNVLTDDGVHSQMYITQSINYLQSYMSIIKSANMDSFQVDISSPNFAVLGQIRHDIVLGEKPTIPYFTVVSSDLPAIPTIEFRTTDADATARTLLIDNRAGVVTVEIGKDSVIEIIIVMGTSTMHVNTDTLRAYYGENARIYVLDLNGKRSLIN